MIGLGSNRLTCCRRGGMSVTQAGRGGMEWLAGGRVPSWASPYSAAATAALKAQFSAEQWATIRDYGFAHPALVPFINEDPMLVCSLMELGKIRWLRSAKNGYIDMPVTYNTLADTLYAKYVYRGTSMSEGSGLFGAYTDNLTIQCYAWRAGFNQGWRAEYGSHSPANTVLETTISKSLRELKSNGVSMKTQETEYTTSTDHTSLRLFKQGNDGTAWDMNGSLAILTTGHNTIVPFVHEGVRTLLDTETGYIGTPSNESNFTIEYTELDGVTPWTPAS